MTLARWQLDVTHWPVAVLALERKGPDAEPDFESFLAACDEVLAKRSRYAGVIDLTGSRSTAARRTRFSEWYQVHRAEVRRYQIALAVVAPNAVYRGVVTAMFWLAPGALGVETFSTQAAAREWATRRAAEDRR